MLPQIMLRVFRHPDRLESPSVRLRIPDPILVDVGYERREFRDKTF
jgi:hypothetical protein